MAVATTATAAAAGPGRAWGRRIKVTVLTLIAVLLVTSVATYFWADGKVRREVDLSKVIDRPETGDGTNYLIVGSDSREGMSAEEKKKLHTGSAEGKRTDSMMILHDGSNGPTLISLPRDSDVEIPSFVGSDSGKKYPGTGRHTKLNAAYAEDGPELLVRTVEFNTKLHIDHYVEIGFAGFANIVDAIGGVEMNIPKAFKDKNSGADFPAGKQTLNGQQALAFVRTRHAFAGSDLDRTKNQQKFLAALASQTATPGHDPQPLQALPDDGRRPGHAHHRQGHEPVQPGPDVLRDEGRHGWRGQVDEHADRRQHRRQPAVGQGQAPAARPAAEQRREGHGQQRLAATGRSAGHRRKGPGPRLRSGPLCALSSSRGYGRLRAMTMRWTWLVPS